VPAPQQFLTSLSLTVNRRRGQAVADIGSNALKAIKKGQSKWGHHRRRSGPHPDADSFIRHKELPALVQGAQFGADSQPTLLLAVGGDVIKPLFEASKGSIPIVGGVSDSPIRSGIAVSLARPSKNFTGITFLTDEMAAKRIELLKQVAPNVRKVAVIFNPQHFDDEVTFARRGAESLDVELTTHPINKIADLDAALQGVEASRADGLLVISSRLTGIVAAKIAQHGQERRLPVIASWREFTDSGALLSYGPSRTFEAKRLVGYVQRVLNGEKPADLPIEQPVKFELVINLKTAKVLCRARQRGCHVEQTHRT